MRDGQEYRSSLPHPLSVAAMTIQKLNPSYSRSVGVLWGCIMEKDQVPVTSPA